MYEIPGNTFVKDVILLITIFVCSAHASNEFPHQANSSSRATWIICLPVLRVI